jgi:RHS repeat-associated protein
VGEYEEAGERYRGITVTLYGKGEAVSLSTTRGTVYLGKDVLGSVRTTTGVSGSIEERYEYDVFGVPYQGDLTQGMDLGYTGKPYDAVTGLYDYGYRDYKAEVARFTSEDPIRDGSNWYAYVNNDPVNWVDPWGLYIINSIDGPSVDDYQEQHPPSNPGSSLGGWDASILHSDSFGSPKVYMPMSTDKITLPNRLNNSLQTAYNYQVDRNPNTNTTITSRAIPLESGNYAISVTVTNSVVNPNGTISVERPRSGIITYAGPGEIGLMGTADNPDPSKIVSIVNAVINTINNTGRHDYKVSCAD